VRTALHDRLEAAGARFAVTDGFETAIDFGDAAGEAAAVRAAAGIADRGARSFTAVAGRDAAKFLQGIVSNDVAGIAVGSAAYALLLTPKARVIADMRITRIGEDAFLIDAEPAAAEPLRATLTRYRLAARAAIEPAEETYGAIAVAGPRAADVIRAAFGVDPPGGGREGDGLELVAGLNAVTSAFCGQLAFDLIGPRQVLGDAWDRLAAALGPIGGRPFGAAAFEILRIEGGVPRFGAELTGEVMPAEAGVVSRAVSFTKGCYIGQEPVARLHYRGHANRGLRRIVLEGAPPEPGTPVAVGGREVGRVTSAAPASTVGRAVALAIVRREIEPGESVDVGGISGQLGAA
jgi:folate-binding protein YgfZ